MARRKTNYRWIDDQNAGTIEALAETGFSVNLIAEIAFGIPQADRSRYATKARSAIYSHLSLRGIRLRDWRDGKLPMAKRFALAKAGAPTRPAKGKGRRRKRRAA